MTYLTMTFAEQRTLRALTGDTVEQTRTTSSGSRSFSPRCTYKGWRHAFAAWTTSVVNATKACLGNPVRSLLALFPFPQSAK